MLGTEETNGQSIDADHAVEKKEQHEVFVVIQADTIVNPDAVMVELLHTYVAESAVLRARWLGNIAGVTPTFLVE